MNKLVMISVVAPFIMLVLFVGTSMLLARRKNAQLFEKAPDVLPYTWGYFLGYSGIIAAILVNAAGAALILAGYYRGWFPIAMAYAAVSAVASYGVLTRQRWGWMFHIPLSLNPGLWAFNSVYASNRWREF